MKLIELVRIIDDDEYVLLFESKGKHKVFMGSKYDISYLWLLCPVVKLSAGEHVINITIDEECDE